MGLNLLALLQLIITINGASEMIALGQVLLPVPAWSSAMHYCNIAFYFAFYRNLGPICAILPLYGRCLLLRVIIYVATYVCMEYGLL